MFDDLISSVTDALGGNLGGLGDLGGLGSVGAILQDLQGQVSPELFQQLTDLANQHGLDPNQLSSLGESLQNLGAEQKAQITEFINQIPGLDSGLLDQLSGYLK